MLDDVQAGEAADRYDAAPDPRPLVTGRPSGAAGWFHWTHGLVNRLVAVMDGVLLTLAGLLAWAAGTGDGNGLTLLQAVVLTGVSLDVYRRGMNACGAYRVENYRLWGRAMIDVFGGIAAAAAVVLLIVWVFLPTALEGSEEFALWGGAVVVLLGAARRVTRRGVRALDARGALRRQVVIFGATDAAERMIHHLSEPEHRENYNILAVFDDRNPEERLRELPGYPVAGDLNSFKRYLQQHRVDMIVIALPWRAAMRIHGLCMQLQMISLDILIPLDQENIKLRLADVQHIGETPALLVMRRPLRGSQIVIKRIEDIVVAGLGLLLASPFMLAAAVAIRLDSPGPIIFRQARVGFNDRPFTMFKFRTMTVDEADDGSAGTVRNDPRITRVGAILRRTSIDELPQLFNVLAGDMSVVGPRAHVPNMLVGSHRYAEAVRTYAARSRVKPGITGWAQINGMRGGIHSIEKARAGVCLDTHYIENWSLWFDVKIIISTLSRGLFGRDVF